jgi:xanthine dehydrogenase accessory factor
MNLSLSEHTQLEAEMQSLKLKGLPFAMATVVRTIDATSAKPGCKALLDPDGKILMGWVGGGCARGAVGKAAREAIKTGEPKFISLRPQELLDSEGVATGELRDGVHFAHNGCPSKGTMDVFVEPILPLPELVICGTGLVAMALSELATRFDFKVSAHAAPVADINTQSTHGFNFETGDFVVVATQGQGDIDALRAALSINFRYVCFVGSRRKFEAISTKLEMENPNFSTNLNKVKAPAGLSINSITPDEIALSILAEITQLRRAGSLNRDRADV